MRFRETRLRNGFVSMFPKSRYSGITDEVKRRLFEKENELGMGISTRKRVTFTEEFPSVIALSPNVVSNSDAGPIRF